MRWNDLARDVAAEYGLELNDEEVDYVLWEHTGFPCFWDGDPVEDCRAQLRDYFSQVQK